MALNFKPILFSTPMVQAILRGEKTQTRRELKDMLYFESAQKVTITDGGMVHFTKEGEATSWHGRPCPYGFIGDILWVRETFTQTIENKFIYKADEDELSLKDLDWNWKSSIHMPKKACRLFLKIINIRVERLHDITEADAIAEGCSKYGPFGEYKGSIHPSGGQMKYRAYSKASRAFECIWTTINGQESWNANPWVWVIEFERIEKPENFI